MISAQYEGDHLDFRDAAFHGPVFAKVEQYAREPAPTALAALPARVAAFTGRIEELRCLLDVLAPSGVSDAGPAVASVAVSGLGGVGKTTLAVTAVHEACSKGWFPGGVLVIDLHGHENDPTTAGQALETLLRALGTPADQIPVSLDERGALYRSELARRAGEDGAVLVLADNASSVQQVRPLLPGDTRHRLLVTSREVLPQLGGRLLTLRALTPQEAVVLLDRALHAADPSDARIAQAPGPAAQLASCCGYLPLALQIAAALLMMDGGKPVHELVRELSVTGRRLVHLDDGERSVRAAFDLSYRRLPSEQAYLLRLLALAPGPEASTEMVMALSGTDTEPTSALEGLVRHRLLERGKARDQWRLHDLVRVYGAAVGPADEAREVRRRVLEFYIRVGGEAAGRLRWRSGGQKPIRFADPARALTWLDRECDGLLTAVQWVSEAEHSWAAVSLNRALGPYLSWRRYFEAWITLARAACQAARGNADRAAEAGALTDLGSALRQAGQETEAIDAHAAACTLFEQGDDLPGLAMARNALGIALQEAGRLLEAVEVHTSNTRLFRSLMDDWGEGLAWTNLGGALRNLRRAAEAADAHQRACVLLQTAGDRHTAASARGNLARCLLDVDRPSEAIAMYRQALATHTEFNDWYGAGIALAGLARAYESTHDHAQAQDHWSRAAEVFTRANAYQDAAAAARSAATEASGPQR
ncbi:tetratricopeptide repeat protein [Streptomyces sp. NPDC091217]|uniref:tetratricopeptide repeat protein n=1 Tax=Streptomyces sp. NPDC091217 TaxID=3365975 RepID=UPI0038209691